jgi:hypothetical protein
MIMAKKNKTQRHKKKRAEARKHQKAKARSQPKLFRRDPILKEALDHRHPLVTCLINETWEEYKFADIYVVREFPHGLVLVNFLVDLAEAGLKDVWGDYGFSKADIEDVKAKSAGSGNALVSCDLARVNDLVYGGIKWAKKWNFKLPKDYAVWLRILPVVNQDGIKLDLFGVDGKPLIILDEEDVDQAIEKEFDPGILKKKLVADEFGLKAETLDYIRDLKSALLNFSHRFEFIEDFEEAATTRFGENDPESEFAWINFQDWFVLQKKLDDGRTIVQRFSDHYKNYLSSDVRQLLLGWEIVIEGLFEVKECNRDRSFMRNLINERDYTVYATSNMTEAEFKPGDFITARIVPAMGVHVFSGAVSIIRGDGSLKQKADIYKTAVELQMKNPAKAFQDNDEKLQKSRDQVREQYEDFMKQFGFDEVLGDGREILEKYQSFFDYQVFEKVNPKTGLTPAAFYESDTGKTYTPPKAEIPEDVLECDDVAMLCDPEEGLSFLIQYRQFMDIFNNPDPHLGSLESEDLVLQYLESESVSDIPFRKVAKRFPDKFQTVMKYLGEQEDFDAVDIDDLMRQFKPDSFNKLPTTVVMLDSEMTYLAQLADKESNSGSGLLHKAWQKITGGKNT